jgi:hypothetical protein
LAKSLDINLGDCGNYDRLQGTTTSFYGISRVTVSSLAACRVAADWVRGDLSASASGCRLLRKCISYWKVNFMHGKPEEITGRIFGNRPLKANL